MLANCPGRNLITLLPLALLLTATFVSAEEIPVHQATVVEVRNAGNYTYVQVEESGESYWIGLPHTMVHKGSEIRFDEQVWMYDFPSKVLNRVFDKVLFVGNVEIVSSPEAPEQAPPTSMVTPSSADGSPMDAGLLAIATVHARKAELAGQQIAIRGKVVKVVDKIMGSSWVHIEDDSSETSNHMVVRVPEREVEVGATVSASGILKADVDYGYGYFYPVIIEEGKISVEEP